MKNQNRKRPIIRTRCTACGLRVVGEMHADGRVYASRHPELVEGDEQPVLCMTCFERTPAEGMAAND